LDLGSCPGGWSWVLSKVAKEVVSVDKAPLDPSIAKIKNIRFLKKDAFKLKPHDIEKVDWLFSDIICEPSRLLELAQLWREAGIKNFVCTIKFKGQTDFDIVNRFKEIAGSRIIHLYHNKHEVTWILSDLTES
jgi:23S rRNA (cytidine2498-2'-O)-methyltransferase